MTAQSAENVAGFMLLYMLCMNNFEEIYLQLKTHGGWWGAC
jgi:hypothetical protein